MRFLRAVIAVLSVFSASFAVADCADCTSVDFDKKIEMHLITPMLQMSLQEKIQHIQKLGVDVFRVADSEGQAITLGFLPYASDDLIPKKFLKLFNEGVLGIYMTPTNFMYTVKKPTILLLESADDWTVIHEFAHYLFDRARLMADSTRESTFVMHSDDSQEDFFDAKTMYRNFDGYMNQEHKERMINSFVVYAKVQMFFSKTAELEETTIEKFLRDMYQHQKPLGFNEKHFERSTRYIHETSMKGQQNLRFLEEDCADLKKTLTSKDQKLLQSLTEVCASVTTLKQQSLKVYEDLHLGLPHQH